MSGNKNWLLRIHDMLDSLALIEKSLGTINEQAFLSNAFLQRGTERCFEILGEAARFVPSDVQKKYDSVEWSQIIGMRHKIAHDYLEIDPKVLWGLYKNDFYGLKDKLQDILNKEDH